MWASGSTDFQNVDLVLERQHMIEPAPQFRPSPYTFTKLESGKKKTKDTTDTTRVTPPSWLLLDHTIAVIWSIFHSDPILQTLSIDDLKWAYEFLKRIKNEKGENPPDVKVCLNEIQDRLIYLYAKLTPDKSESEDFDDIDAFGEDIIQDSTTSYINASYFTDDLDSKFDTLSLSSSKNNLSLLSSTSLHDFKTTGDKELTPDAFPLLEDSALYGEEVADEEVEKYVLSLFEEEKKEEALRAKGAKRSLIPKIKKKKTTAEPPQMLSGHDPSFSMKKEKKPSKRVHCIAQMRSLQFQKSMKVNHTNGEQAAYSKLKTEILTIKPNASEEGVMKILKEWRSEQVHHERKQFSGIDEYVRSLNHEVTPKFMKTPGALKDTEKGLRPLLLS